MAGWRGQGRRRSDRGSSSATQMALIIPLIFAFVLLAIQASMWFYARNVALAAAEAGARVSAGRTSTLGEGLAAAEQFAAQAGGNTLNEVSVTGSRSAETTTITVVAQAQRLLPAVPIDLAVTQTASLPVERLS
mgnify:CR=1 FL=1